MRRRPRTPGPRSGWIDVTRSDGYLVIWLIGRIDDALATQLVELARAYHASGLAELIVDVSRLELYDDVIVGEFIAAICDDGPVRIRYGDWDQLGELHAVGQGEAALLELRQDAVAVPLDQSRTLGPERGRRQRNRLRFKGVRDRGVGKRGTQPASFSAD